MNEIELCFNLSQDSWVGIENAIGGIEPGVIQSITDYYVSPTNRVRFIDGEQYALLTTKEGNKEGGVRCEHESCVQANGLYGFFDSVPLKVEKERKVYRQDSFVLIVDVVNSPLRHIRVEFEFASREMYDKILPIVDKYALTKCPFGAWNFHRRRVGVAGGPSSGKTTVAKSLSIELNKRYGANSLDVVEYATSFLQKQKRFPTLADQLLIYLKQMERENVIADSADIVVSDCPTFLSYVYARRIVRNSKGTPFSDLVLNSLYKRAVHSLSSYANLYLLDTKEYVENNVRFHDFESSREIRSEIKAFAVDHGRDIKSGFTYDDVDLMLDDIMCFNECDRFVVFLEEMMRGQGTS